MSLIPGTRIGSYEIVAPIGAGGMGEVYRATDSHLKRSVAIKVLPAAMASDADRLARFQREAEVLAALNHPNIAAIYGLEKTPDFTALVMELVEGDDLSQRIARGPIPLDEALPIAQQIAEALEAAHDQGIIHRDLKPANIKVRADGTVKVLDFGLAKAMGQGSGIGDQGSGGAANSPTITTPAMTQAGMILGTAAYMAPEQARGKVVDKRADIWAFGAVLFEMLSGTRAFGEEDVSLTLASVLKQDVRWAALPAHLPAPMLRLLGRCLEKEPKKRLRDIGEARLALEDPASLEPAVAPSSSPAAPAAPLRGRALPWATAALFGAGLAAALLVRAPGQDGAVPESRRLLAGIGADAYIVDSNGFQVAISPDGKTLVFVGARKTVGSRPQLYVRRLDQLQATPLDGTDGAFAPFFSPDSQWIAFFVDTASGGVLRRIPVAGGAASTICDAGLGRGGWWAEDDSIVFSQIIPATTLMRVPAAGGTPVAFGTFGEGAMTQRWPQVLPGGERVLYTENSSTGRFENANLVVAALSGGAPKVIVQGGTFGRYLAIGSSGYLTYVRLQTLMAMPFDLSRLEPTGPAVPVVEDVSASSGGAASVAFLPDGTLVYLPDTSTEPTSAIQWLSRDGTISVLRAAETHWSQPRFSPDGRQLALVEAVTPQRRVVFVQDVTRDVLPRQVSVEGLASSPAWTPDGKRLAIGLDPGNRNLWLTSADGSGTPTRLTTGPNTQDPGSWDPSGQFLAYTEIRPSTARDVMILPVEGDATRGWKAGTPTVFKGSAAQESQPAFSPDGRWIAYTASEANSPNVFVPNVYVSPFPGPGATVRVSQDGGDSPRWSAHTHELLFSNRGTIMSVSYTAAGTFVPGRPKPWAPQGGMVISAFEPHPDGTRAAVGLVDAEARQEALYSRDKIVFWSGFSDYLRQNVVAKP